MNKDELSRSAAELKGCPFCGTNKYDFDEHRPNCFLKMFALQVVTDFKKYSQKEMELAWNIRPNKETEEK